MGIETIIEDWPAVKNRWEAWWNCDLFDRVVICISAPRDGVQPASIEEVDPEKKWTDVDFMIRRMREEIRCVWYGGERLPMLNHGLSVGHSLTFGCEPEFATDTAWVAPLARGKQAYPTFDGWQSNPWWDWMQQATEKAARMSRGDYFVLPVWGNHAGDTLAMMLGTEELAIDVAMEPDLVAAAIKQLSDILMEQFNCLWEIVQTPEFGIEGSVELCGCWSPGKAMTFDCDFACMISPDAYERIFLGPLIETMRSVDHRIYHLDGEDAVRHLDALLELPELHAIEWVPGAGREEALQWVPLLQRIQGKGKAVFVFAEPDEVEGLLGELRPEGLCLYVQCASESEGRRLLERVGQLS